MKFNILTNEYVPHIDLNNFKDEVYQALRNKIRFFLNQGNTLNFKDIFLQALLSLGVQDPKIESSEDYHNWFNNLTCFYALKKYLQDPSVHEVILHNDHHLQIIKKEGCTNIEDNIINQEDFNLALEILAYNQHMTWNYKTPFCSFNIQLFNQTFRATLIHYSTTPKKQSKLFLRKINNEIFKLNDFNIDQDCINFIQSLIHSKKNIVISGSTCSGKTSLLSASLRYINSNEHLVILEDTHEIQVNHNSTSYFLADENNKGKTLKDYCAYALRIRPDRIILGEMRSNEVIPFILSMNTGHKGLISTIHANSAKDAISRMGLLFSLYSDSSKLNYNLVVDLICQNIDYIIHMEHKEIKEIIQVFRAENSIPIFEELYTK